MEKMTKVSAVALSFFVPMAVWAAVIGGPAGETVLWTVEPSGAPAYHQNAAAP